MTQVFGLSGWKDAIVIYRDGEYWEEQFHFSHVEFEIRSRHPSEMSVDRYTSLEFRGEV